MEIDHKLVSQLKELYPKGTELELIHMPNDPHPVPAGTKGVVVHVDDVGTIHVKWENGSSLGLISGVDKWKVNVGKETEPIDPVIRRPKN